MPQEVAGRRQLDLASLPHVEVVDLERRIFIAGSTRIAQTLAEGIRREAERGRRAFVELRRPHSHLFRQLDKERTKTGTIPKPGRTIAVDPRVFPLGSCIRLGDRHYIAEDVGSAIKGFRIDIYHASHSEAKRFGIKELTATLC